MPPTYEALSPSPVMHHHHQQRGRSSLKILAVHRRQMKRSVPLLLTRSLNWNLNLRLMRLKKIHLLEGAQSGTVCLVPRWLVLLFTGSRRRALDASWDSSGRRWHPPPPPTQYYLGYAYACSLFFKAPPIWGLPTFPNTPFAGFSRAFLPWRPH